MKSPEGSELLAAPRIVGWPTSATPWRTLSMKPGPNLGLKTPMQCGPHSGVAAPAERAPAVVTPPATVSAAAAASAVRLRDMMGSSFVRRALGAAWGWAPLADGPRRAARQVGGLSVLHGSGCASVA